MKKLVLLVVSILSTASFTLAEGALNMQGQIINSRIFSTQSAHQYETLERNNYQNSAIRQIEQKNYQPTAYTKQSPTRNDELEEKKLKNLFKGFRIIY